MNADLASIHDIARDIARTALNQIRLVWDTPAAYWPVAALGGAMTAAWIARALRLTERRSRVIDFAAWIAGATCIVWFLHGGSVDWNLSVDWGNSWLYFSALKQALLEGRAPYHLRMTIQGTERFFANLEAPLTPAAPLLLWTPVGRFFLAHLLLYYTAGFLGLLAIKRRLSLSSFGWSLFFVVFLFNGHILAHLSSGHSGWVGYYLLPWLFVGLLRVESGDCGRSTTTILIATLGGLIVSGSWHIFVWSWLFVAIFCLTSRARIGVLLRASLGAALVGAVRLAPAVLTFGTGDNRFLGGYPGIRAVIEALIASPGWLTTTRWPAEADTFVGVVGGALLVLGGLTWGHPARRMAHALLVPSLVLLVLSLWNVYELTLFRLPGFVSERVATRLLILPVLALALMGVVRIDRWLAARPRVGSLGAIGALGAGWLLVMQLSVRAASWRPAAGAHEPAMADVLKQLPSDAQYIWSVRAGAVVSLATLILILLTEAGNRVGFRGRAYSLRRIATHPERRQAPHDARRSGH